MGENDGKELMAVEFDQSQIELIKRTVAKGTTNDELRLFLYTAKRTGLDPLLKQIHAVKRFSRASGGEVMAIQTGIDGYRLIAERSGKYAPGKEPSYTYDDKGVIVSATAYVKKLAGGAWHEVGATAFSTEYAQYTKEGKLNAMWAKMPHVMIAKCAEALALRRAFPVEMSGVYTFEEMGQAENTSEPKSANPPEGPKELGQEAPPEEKQEHPADEELITEKQGKRLYAIWKAAGKKDEEVKQYLIKTVGIGDTRKIPKRLYEQIVTWCQTTGQEAEV